MIFRSKQRQKNIYHLLSQNILIQGFHNTHTNLVIKKTIQSCIPISVQPDSRVINTIFRVKFSWNFVVAILILETQSFKSMIANTTAPHMFAANISRARAKISLTVRVRDGNVPAVSRMWVTATPDGCHV